METNELVRAIEHPRTVNFDTMVRVCELLGANYRWLKTDTQAPFEQTRALIDASALSKHIIQQDYIELYIARVPEHRALVFVRSTPWRFVHIARLDMTRCERCVEHVKAIMYIDVRWATLDRSQHSKLASGSIYPGTFFIHEMVAV